MPAEGGAKGPDSAAPAVIMHPEAERLFALDEALRAEAEDVLAASGIGEILAERGYVAAGSYTMHTMAWRDLDFERPEDEPDWGSHFATAKRIAMTGWCWRVVCTNNYRVARADPHLYIGLRATDPASRGRIVPAESVYWKMDLLSMPSADLATHVPRRERWRSLMTEEKRAAILAIKNVVCHEPEYRRTIHSVQIYDAVLEHGVRGLEDFRRWLRAPSPPEEPRDDAPRG